MNGHQWIVVCSYRVSPGSGDLKLRAKSLLKVSAPGCERCELTWSPDVAREPCAADVKPGPMPNVVHSMEDGSVDGHEDGHDCFEATS